MLNCIVKRVAGPIEEFDLRAKASSLGEIEKNFIERRRKVTVETSSVIIIHCVPLGGCVLLVLQRMSVLNQSGEEQVECPLCMEPLEVDDLNFYPCTCGYQICRFCWNRIREGENGLCPACRKAYPENPADFTPLSQEQVAAIKTEKKAREQKKRNKTLESRRALANVRVVQNNLVFVVGLPVRLADPEILKRQEYFGKYGKIHKVVINQSTTYAGSQGPSASAYVTYLSSADALRAIQGVNNVTLDGRVLKSSLGTTKYCANFMKNQPCPKPDCMYLHELGDPKASFTKEEMHAGLHQVYERKLHNQLLNATSGGSSTNAEKSSSKEGNQLNFIPTTVVTSSHINNVVNSSSSKSKNKNSSSDSSSSSGSSTNGKDAWPSLGTSPPKDSIRGSPKPSNALVKSQENGTPPESSSPPLTQQNLAKSKDIRDTKPSKMKEVTNGTSQPNKKAKTDKKQKSNSINDEEDKHKQTESPQINSVFENEQQYLSNELDELESDRHSLLENHDLFDNNDHKLLEDDSHSLLNDVNNEVLMMQRQREMLAGLVDNTNLMPQMKVPMVNGYGLLDRDVMNYLGSDRQISQGLIDQKEMMLRDRSRSEMLMRQQNEMLARQHNAMVESKHFMPTSSIGLESASELLGANFHPNPNMLPPFGMRVDNSIANALSLNNMGNTLSANALGNSMVANSLSNTMSANSLGNMTTNIGNMSVNIGNMSANIGNISANIGSMTTNMGNQIAANVLGNTMSNNTLGGGYLMQNQQLLQNHQLSGLVNGFDTNPPQISNEGRYLAENMDKFFTDFHKAQQMRQILGSRSDNMNRYVEPSYPHNMLSAERLEMEHKQRMNNLRVQDGTRAAGDGDDDLDFDPFKETQKALAEMMESEMMQNSVSGGDNVRRSRLAPPGFSNVNSFGIGVTRQQQAPQQSFNSNSAVFSDWTQMDPAIMSTSVSLGKPAPQPQTSLSLQQQELIARFNQIHMQPNGIKQVQVPQWQNQKLQQWSTMPTYNNIPLPPGFASAKPPQHPAECIDAK